MTQSKMNTNIKQQVVYILIYHKADGQMNMPFILGTYNDKKILLDDLEKRVSTFSKKRKNIYNKHKNILDDFFSSKKKMIFVPTDNAQDFYDLNSMQHEKNYGTFPDIESSGFTIIKNIINTKTNLQLIGI